MVVVAPFQPNVAQFQPRYLIMIFLSIIFDILNLALTIRFWHWLIPDTKTGFDLLSAWYMILLSAVHSIMTFLLKLYFSVLVRKHSTDRNVWPGPIAVVRDTSQCQAEGEEGGRYWETTPPWRNSSTGEVKVQIMCVWKEVTVHLSTQSFCTGPVRGYIGSYQISVNGPEVTQNVSGIWFSLLGNEATKLLHNIRAVNWWERLVNQGLNRGQALIHMTPSPQQVAAMNEESCNSERKKKIYLEKLRVKAIYNFCSM